MSDSNFIEKDTISQKKKNNLFKPILIGISVISISFLLFICLNMKNNSQIKTPTILAEAQKKNHNKSIYKSQSC